jgi:hypothetical protein
MSSKLFPTLATVAVALAGAVAMSGAMAVEATQFDPAPGTKTRAEVKAELANADRGVNVVHLGEATVFVDQPATLSHDTVRFAARETDARVVHLGEATQFVYEPSTRSRADVRAETLAAIHAARVARQ